jgi:hypothetical protein
MTRPSWAETTPDTERTWAGLTPDVLVMIADADAEVLAAQRAQVAPEIAAKIIEPTYSLRNRLRYWEQLVRLIEQDWAPRGRYVVDEYVNNLDSRDSLDRVLARLPVGVGTALRPLLDDLDSRFASATVDDGGEELRPWVARLRQGEPMSGRWYRRPRVIPWQ